MEAISHIRDIIRLSPFTVSTLPSGLILTSIAVTWPGLWESNHHKDYERHERTFCDTDDRNTSKRDLTLLQLLYCPCMMVSKEFY